MLRYVIYHVQQEEERRAELEVFRRVQNARRAEGERILSAFRLSTFRYAFFERQAPTVVRNAGPSCSEH
jgi:hypothetical protein